MGNKSKEVVVKFVLSPTGRFGLGYNIGDEAPFSEEKANELIESGYAVPVKEVKKTAQAPAKEAAPEETSTDEAPAEEAPTKK